MAVGFQQRMRTGAVQHGRDAGGRIEPGVGIDRLDRLRSALAVANPNLCSRQGLFASLLLSPNQVELLRRDWSIHAVASGRINIAGLF